jgi:hypothetical protein
MLLQLPYREFKRRPRDSAEIAAMAPKRLAAHQSRRPKDHVFATIPSNWSRIPGV